MSILGHPVLRVEDQAFLTSGARYVADLPLANSATVTFVRSPVAHARIVSIDTSAARSAPGVLAVVTGEELGLGLSANLLPVFPEAMRRPFLASGTVRFVGESVVAIVAESAATAADAADLVVVDYEPLPAVVDPHVALDGGVPLFAGTEDNVVVRSDTERRADFSRCAIVVSQPLVNQRIAGAPLEGRAGAAWWEGERLVHVSACQGAHPAQASLAQVYGIEPAQIRVIVPAVGGGFGSKARPSSDEAMLGALSKLVGRPVSWVETRSENMVGLAHGRAQHQTVTIGGTADGRIEAFQLDVVQESGAYPMMGAFLINMTRRMAAGVYDIAQVEFSGVSVATNTTPVTAFRGAGRPEAAAAIERAVDLFAAECGLDPVEVRRRNLVPRFDQPHTTAIGTAYDCGDYAAVLDAALAAADYEELRAEQARRRAAGDRRLLGIGVAVYVEITAGANGFEYGSVTLLPDGRAKVVTGSTPQGQGHDTAWAMIVADRTGLRVADVEVIHGDTDLVPSSGITGGSRSAQVAGTAVAVASTHLIDQAKKYAAELLEAAEPDIVVDTASGRLHVAGTPTRSVGWSEIAAAAAAAGADPLTGLNDFTAPMPTFPFGAHIAVVEVDADTGRTTLLRLVACDDAGTILNPLLVDGQVHGGLAAGVAQALYEEIRYDAEGNPLTTNFADYLFPAAADLPSFERVPHETATWVNELGAKGIGESGTIGSTPAVQNAVIDALSHLGVRHLDLPLRPERVWRAIAAAS